MREFGFSSLSLAGSLLIAHPGLLDPNFRRSVLFLSANSPDEGSFGLILNRPAGRTVAEVLPERDLGALGRIAVHLGGPVSTDELVFAAFRWDAEEEAMACRHHLGLDEAEALAQKDGAIVRAFVGYAGWSKGQLEGEIAQHGWLVKKPEGDVFDREHGPALWRELIAEFGPQFRLIAEAPDDPSRN